MVHEQTFLVSLVKSSTAARGQNMGEIGQ